MTDKQWWNAASLAEAIGVSRRSVCRFLDDYGEQYNLKPIVVEGQRSTGHLYYIKDIEQVKAQYKEVMPMVKGKTRGKSNQPPRMKGTHNR